MSRQRNPEDCPMPTGYCWCGCGERPKNRGSYFIASHDRKAETALIRFEYGDIARFLWAHGWVPPTAANPSGEWDCGQGEDSE